MDKRENIPEKLIRENKIRILGEYTGSANHHDLLCLVCGNEWSATPKSKTQTFKKYGVSGCPACNLVNKERVNVKTLIENLTNVPIRYIKTTRFVSFASGMKRMVLVENTDCGHTFETRSDNLISHKISCRVCNDLRKRKAFQGYNKVRQELFEETANEWQIYRNLVHSLTRIVYNEHKDEINPLGHIRGKAGVDGAYQLDHINAVRYCFDNGISAEDCANKENLQMLTWEENLSFKDKPKQ